ncbi:MAG: PfkB family carbohydrate kinase, partial [Nitrolancea sp.]
MMSKVVAIGSINTDFVVRTRRFPVPGETIAGESFDIFGGGKGANQAIAAARLGAAVTFFGAAGEDANSDQRVADLEREGI